MCGLAGVVLSARTSVPISNIVDDMATTLAHRGPDSGGRWIDTEQGIGLSHRRLSIVDLSEHGRQPMISQNERYVLAYNGEVYNHLEVRDQLNQETGPIRWSGHSDTETIVEAIAHWGLEKTLTELVGMFAIALWDRQEGELTLARDRIGEKPLYFGILERTLAFGSELKALRKVPQFILEVNPHAVASFMRLGYVPEPHSIYNSIAKVPAGTFISFSKDDVARNILPPAKKYWSFVDVAERGLARRSEKSSLAEAVDRLEKLLTHSIEGQLMGDVPVGAFLSGGVDSSTVVALMQKISRAPVKTFSIGFEERQYDESGYAREMADYLGTEHHSITFSSGDAQSVIPKLAGLSDEPFADSSQIPTYLVSKLARQEVSVSLSGDGGDELFAGYNRYSTDPRRWASIANLPVSLRRVVSSAILRTPPGLLNNMLSPILGGHSVNKGKLPGDKLHKLAGVLGSSNARELYENLNSVGRPNEILFDSKEIVDSYSTGWPIKASLTEQMMALDTLRYLPSDILVKVDRASMSFGLETRMPFLDHRLVEFAWTLPLSMKLSNQATKAVLRGVLEKHVPTALFERPKMGFGMPLAEWLRGPLREWAEDFLSTESLVSSGYLDPLKIRQIWAEHQSMRRDHRYTLWTILMFQTWHHSSIGSGPSCELA